MKYPIYKKFSLPYLITKLSRSVLRDYEQKMSKLEISPLQGGVLFVISDLMPVNQTEISNILFIDKVTLSKIFVILLEKGLVEIAAPFSRRQTFRPRCGLALPS